tara:strand:- start:892 stop:2463 length:1572 start_codon:yes stop_codon:yes gene_type:complete
MNKNIKILFLVVLFNILKSQTCPPADTTLINPIQNSWTIPNQNNWTQLEVMTWNLKQFPLSSNTVNYVSEIITDLMPDVVLFQEVEYSNSWIQLSEQVDGYEFVNPSSGWLAFAYRKDVIAVESQSFLFNNSSDLYNFAWRPPFVLDVVWNCGLSTQVVKIINVHFKCCSDGDSWDRRYAAAEKLSSYISDHQDEAIIVAGDFNDEITDAQNVNSLWPLISNNNLYFTTTPIAGSSYYNSFLNSSFIDHIFISSALFNLYDQTGETSTIRLDDYLGYSFYTSNVSDHKPVILSMSIPSNELPTGIVINEIMNNPQSVSDSFGEWIEITNISSSRQSLNGLILSDSSSDYHIINDLQLEIDPNDFIVLGRSENFSLNGGVNVDYVYSDFSLSNNFDEVILYHPSGAVVDQVAYDNGLTFPDEAGISMMLESTDLDNNLGSNWSLSSSIMPGGDYGTPGSQNTNQTECNLLGDANLDSLVNVLDVVKTISYILGETIEFLLCSDINNDQVINVLDAVSIVNIILE